MARSLYIQQQKDYESIKLLRENQKQQRNYYSILQAIPEGFVIMNKQMTQIEFTNEQMIQLFQCKNEMDLLLKTKTEGNIDICIGNPSYFNIDSIKNELTHNS